MMTRYTYWEHTRDGHNKFWAASILEDKRQIQVGSTKVEKTFYVLVRKWGAIGTEGQSMSQTFNDRNKAEELLYKLVREKETKGYKGVF